MQTLPHSSNKKKKIIFHSNCSRVLTGFGKNAKNVLSYLFQTGKYEIVEVANGVKEDSRTAKLFPWKCIGSFPSGRQIEAAAEKSPEIKRKAGYGHLRIDSIIESEKPDIYIGAEDIWAFQDFWNKRWWKKINSILWTTIDSSPVLESAMSAAGETKNFFCWSRAAAREMNEGGAENVRHLHGPIDHQNFLRLGDEEREAIRAENGISEGQFVVGFVFRNQLRKSVPNLLDGFIKFKEGSGVDAKLLLHTNWQEGWDIPRLLKEKGINNEDILTTYFCNKCSNYKIQSFASSDKKTGERKDCPHCKSEKSFSTVGVEKGPTESQLNEIYNSMDVYCHPFTSGGQELPIQEAKLCELITLVTDYSCGKDCSSPESGGFPLKWHEYREPGTQFIKASTDPVSIAEELFKVYNMAPEEKRKLGRVARKFVIKNYSIEEVCKELMKILDKLPAIDWNFSLKDLVPNVDHAAPEGLTDKEFIKDLYENMLKVHLEEESPVYNYLLERLEQGVSRSTIHRALRDNAKKEVGLTKKNEYNITDFLDKEDKGSRMAVVLPRSIGDVFLSTSLLKNLKELYPDYNLYYITSPKYFSILDGNPYVHKVIPHDPICDDALYLEGFSGREEEGDHEGYFEVALLLNVNNQRIMNYTRNGKDKRGFEICI